MGGEGRGAYSVVFRGRWGRVRLKGRVRSGSMGRVRECEVGGGRQRIAVKTWKSRYMQHQVLLDCFMFRRCCRIKR